MLYLSLGIQQWPQALALFILDQLTWIIYSRIICCFRYWGTATCVNRRFHSLTSSYLLTSSWAFGISCALCWMLRGEINNSYCNKKKIWQQGDCISGSEEFLRYLLLPQEHKSDCLENSCVLGKILLHFPSLFLCRSREFGAIRSHVTGVSGSIF